MRGGAANTVIFRRADAGLYARSIATHVTVVAPTINIEPEGGPHLTTTAPSTASLAVGCVKTMILPYAESATTVMSSHMPVITGGVVSVRGVCGAPSAADPQITQIMRRSAATRRGGTRSPTGVLTMGHKHTRVPWQWSQRQVRRANRAGLRRANGQEVESGWRTGLAGFAEASRQRRATSHALPTSSAAER